MYQKPIKGSHLRLVKGLDEIQFSYIYFFLSFSNIYASLSLFYNTANFFLKKSNINKIIYKSTYFKLFNFI